MAKGNYNINVRAVGDHEQAASAYNKLIGDLSGTYGHEILHQGIEFGATVEEPGADSETETAPDTAA